MKLPSVSAFLVGDPVRLVGPSTIEDVLRATGGSAGPAPRPVMIAPGIAVVHQISAPSTGVALHWVTLSPASRLSGFEAPVEIVIRSTASRTKSHHLVQLLGELAARLSEPAVMAAARAATTREMLVDAFGFAGETAGERRLPVTAVFALLETSGAGLGSAQAVRRLAECGPNRLERVARRPLLLRLGTQFVSFFALLLWVGGILALLAGMPEFTFTVFVVILINGIFSFLQEYRAERAVAALEKLLPPQVTVQRDGTKTRVPVSDVVPGDVVWLDEGDQVPADGRLLVASGLRVDQSALTGESRPVFKRSEEVEPITRAAPHERPELVFAGTAVVSGQGSYLVLATGMATEIGGIADLTQTVPQAVSPLQIEMARVTRVVTALALAFGGAFFAIGVVTGLLPVTDGLVFALGVIIANVPEGLLPTLTLALAMGVQRMARHRTIVKRLSAAETLGATTVICTDKTGTLTENRMEVRVLRVVERTVDLPTIMGYDAEVASLLEAGVLASTATSGQGDPTEVALVRAATGQAIDAESARAARPVLAAYPFDSFRKRMTLVRHDGGDPVAFVKGAPKPLFELCDRVRLGDRIEPLTDSRRRILIDEHDRLASEGFRLLAVAVRPLSAIPAEAASDVVERDLVLLGFVALWDPPRAEVEQAVAVCRRAGIQVIMITGDDGLTARAIARRVGIRAEKVVTGHEVERLGPAGLHALLQSGHVLFARTSPAHKLAIVTALRDRGEVVAVTGDGINDAPALRAADIGVAMGRRASAVAKEAAEMVITDDNFASIVLAIQYGRAIYANIGKFITYIFTHNFAELAAFVAFAVGRIPLPLGVMQVLAIDLATEVLPALGLGAERPEPGVMDRPPRRRDEHVLGARRLLRAYAFLGMVEGALALFAFFWTYWLAGWRPGLPMATEGELYTRATTMTFAGIVAAQVGNVFACRTERESVFSVGLFRNRLVILGVVAELLLLTVLILVPPLARIFGVAPLAFREWSVLLVFPPTMVLLEEARKAIGRLARLSHGDRRRVGPQPVTSTPARRTAS